MQEQLYSTPDRVIPFPEALSRIEDLIAEVEALPVGDRQFEAIHKNNIRAYLLLLVRDVEISSNIVGKSAADFPHLQAAIRRVIDKTREDIDAYKKEQWAGAQPTPQL